MVEPASHWAYDLLKKLACDTSLSAHDIEDLKSVFSDEIGSVRKADRIRNVHELIDCLERHDELSEYNINNLKVLSDQCGSSTLRHAVAAYQVPKETTFAEPVNLYKEMRLAEELRRKIHVSESNNFRSGATNEGSVLVNPPILYPSSFVDPHTAATQRALASQRQLPMPVAYTEQKRTAIFKLLSEELGTSWRNFGRELRIREGTLDEIEVQYTREIKPRVYRLLEHFEEDERNDPKKFVLTLMRALNDCRRKDLRREVENIMSH